MPFAFENLEVYQKSVDFADAACPLPRGFPRGYFFLADQLNRTALSIAVNIAGCHAQAEGAGKLVRVPMCHSPVSEACQTSA